LLKANPQTASIPLLFISNAIRPSERIEGLTIGAVDYVTKPYVAEEVLARIGIHLNLAEKLSSTTAESSSTAQEIGDTDELIVQAAIRFIATCLDNPPPLTEIAQRLGTHQKRLSAAFRDRLGTTVYGYIRAQRLQLACKLLKESDISIDNVAALIGFRSACNFSTAFREWSGVAPTDFRKEWSAKA
jgi:transcriptional regulator GlxA family with amidase domain